MNSRERFMSACRSSLVGRPPVWLMRQAGRYLPEYRDLREKYDFKTLCRRPELIFEVSMQPWRRFEMDAVIVFSDILLPLEAMGPRLEFVEDVGPRFEYAIKTKRDLDRLEIPRVRLSFGYLYEAIENIRQELNEKVALLGFVGAPWTLAVYLMEGGSGDFQYPLEILKSDSRFVHELMDKIGEAVISHAVEQVRAGADAIQIFDTWGGLLSSSQYRKHCLPFIKRIVDGIHNLQVPAILFIKKSSLLIEEMIESGADVISVGSDINLSDVFGMAKRNISVQGNLDSELLLRSPSVVKLETQKMLDSIKGQTGYIANLGHGILPNTPVESVKAFIETVKQYNC